MQSVINCVGIKHFATCYEYQTFLDNSRNSVDLIPITERHAVFYSSMRNSIAVAWFTQKYEISGSPVLIWLHTSP